jgi:hypothetical protein
MLIFVDSCGFLEETNFLPTGSGMLPDERPPWWNSDWTYRKMLTFNNSAQSQDLTNFPVLVRLNSTRINYLQTRDNGEDLRLVDGDGTLLSHEIESWDESGESILWVKVPRIDGGSSSDFIWIYYGNDSAPDTQDAVGVWANGYELVMHLDESSGDFEDSTGNGHFGAPRNGVSRGVGGKIGKSVQFDGNDDYIALNKSYSGQGTVTVLTVCVWFSTTFSGSSYNDNWAFVDFDRSDFYDFYIAGDSGALEFSTSEVGSGIDDFPGNTAGLNDGNWYLGWALYDNTDKLIYLNSTVDGFRANPHGGNGLGLSSTRWGIMGDGSEATSFDGTRNNIHYMGSIDEVRIAHAVRSQDWIKAQYLSMSDTYITFSSEESY